MDNLRFKVSSALKDLVGKDLIRNDNIAIFELVKNSYDAFATKVEITFEQDRIVIADNGKGMSLDDLKNKWLFLAYSAKKDGTEDDEKQLSYRDKINRHYAGAKGVGRFSCDRLGAHLLLKTKNLNDKNAEQLEIDWANFEQDQKQEFVKINVRHETPSKSPKFPENKKTGTILEITNLRVQWTVEKIFDLRTSLEKLINPFAETQDFTIEIICPWAKKNDEIERLSKKKLSPKKIVNGLIRNSISQVISIKTTRIDVSLNEEYIETSVVDRDTEIYRIREKNNFEKLSSVTINLYFLNKAAKTSFSLKMGVQPVQYGSIFLFRNGFRILPFGNPGDDSWKLDYRAQQGYNRFLGTRDLFGRVDIQTDDIEEFKEVSSRDGGLIESETTLQLRRLFEIAHHRLERYVTGVLWGEGFLKRQYFNDIAEVEKNRELLGADKDLDTLDYVIRSSLGSKIDFVQLVKTLISDKNIEVLYYNKDLANIFADAALYDDANPQVIEDLERIARKTKDGNLLSTVNGAKEKIAELKKQKLDAERRAEEADLRAEKARQERDLAQYNAAVAVARQNKAESESKRMYSENLFLSSDVNKDVKQMASLQHHITHTSSFIHALALKAIDAVNSGDKEKAVSFIQRIIFENTKISTLSNFVSKAKFDLMSKKITKDIVVFVNEYMNNVYSLANGDMNISVAETSVSCELQFAPIDVIVVLDSLLDNSRKAGAKNISIQWEKKGTKTLLCFSDDGCGISDKILAKVFDYRFSTTNGGGLGLYHVQEICKKMNVEVSIDNKCHGVKFIFVFK